VLAIVYRRAAPLIVVAIGVLAADGLAGIVKQLVGENRPDEPDPLVTIPHSHSFPSGHTATAVAGATLLTFFAPKGAPAFFLVAAIVAYSRLYVGVHFPLDIVGGAVIGAATALLLLATIRRLSARAPRAAR
jgi:undecaprenyl-diphosphatase